MMAGENRKDGDWRSWSLIVILFAVGVWPVALFLLFRKLFGEDAKNRQNVSAPPPAMQTLSTPRPCVCARICSAKSPSR